VVEEQLQLAVEQLPVLYLLQDRVLFLIQSLLRVVDLELHLLHHPLMEEMVVLVVVQRQLQEQMQMEDQEIRQPLHHHKETMVEIHHTLDHLRLLAVVVVEAVQVRLDLMDLLLLLQVVLVDLERHHLSLDHQ
jgi:hypothetical protein